MQFVRGLIKYYQGCFPSNCIRRQASTNELFKHVGESNVPKNTRYLVHTCVFQNSLRYTQSDIDRSYMKNNFSKVLFIGEIRAPLVAGAKDGWLPDMVAEAVCYANKGEETL